MARTLALLAPYYDKSTPQSVREMEAEDWADALGRYPQWAIQRAARWWKGEANDKRNRRPLEGDISARCRVEMDAVLGAKRMIEAGIPFAKPQAEERPEITAEERERRRATADEIAGSFLNRAAAAKISPESGESEQQR